MGNISKEQPNPVNRTRRAAFVFITVAVAFGLSTTLALTVTDSETIKIVAGKMLDLAQMLGVAYVGASSIDYTIKPILAKWNGEENRERGD